MAARKETRRYDVAIAYRGKRFSGYAIVEGTRKLTQWVYYGLQSRFDGHGYRPDQWSYMQTMAKTILRELVIESGDSPRPSSADIGEQNPMK